MDLRRLRLGEWIAAISGAALIVSLWLPWWDVGSVSFTSWEALSVVDGLLFVLGVFGIAVLPITAVARTTPPSIASESLLVPFALVMAIVCLLRVLNVPDGLEGATRAGLEVSREIGAWLGLLASFGVLVGALVGMRDERLSKPGRPTDQTGVPVSEPQPVEKLPAPPAA
jgi:hypothetical protein